MLPCSFVAVRRGTRPGGCTVARLRAAAIIFSAFVIVTPRCLAADQWGGSLALTSDYFVRGITRSNDQAALQLDLHFADASGFLAGLFASNTQIDPSSPRDVELEGYVGFSWSGSGSWHGKILAGYYAYPWNAYGSEYNYAELDLDIAYQDWLDIGVSYSPNAPRYNPSAGLIGVSAESVELNLQRPVLGKLSGTAGVGYYSMSGPDGTGYVYWSVGAAYDVAPVSLTVSYIGTTAGAKTLFYNDAAGGGRWVGTAIWRF
jgi:uncharacterized protein (TIGR02001 family)